MTTATGALPLPAILFPSQPDSPKTVAPFAALIQQIGARRLWMGQSLKAETHQVLAHLAGMGHSVPVGTSVTLMPLRHPYEAALQARSLALITGHAVVAGYGASAPGFVRSLTGAPYASPRSAARDYLTSVRSLLDGEIVELPGPQLPPRPLAAARRADPVRQPDG
ncbi:LLM class flavin-dependent oxidoreductase [Streptomyces sp. R-74717]|uniref:LLM class flavin-dependent oxidoreductase n=1 Tax=Streptomyces TaxID=1883 RepID=UPI0037B4FD1B